MSIANNISYRTRAALLDAISRGFSYPDSYFYDDLVSGEYIQAFNKDDDLKDKSSLITNCLSEIESGARVVVAGRNREDLESEYIGLFELNQKQAPLHLYAGLHLQSEGGRLEILKRLTGMYRDYGLDMEEGSEHADHLIVVLEFLSFLYKQMGLLQTVDDAPGLQQLQTDIRSTINEMGWTKSLDKEIVARQGHPFYLPLSKLLQAVLALP